MNSKIQKAYSYWKRKGLKAFVARILHEIRSREVLSDLPLENPMIGFVSSAHPEKAISKESKPVSRSQLFKKRFPNLATVSFAESIPKNGENNLWMVTDSIGKGSLFGGVGTALIFSTLLANRTNRKLVVFTRTELSTRADYDGLMAMHGIGPEPEVTFVYHPLFDKKRVVYSDDDLFISTSWWTTYTLLEGGVKPSSIIYLLQEDERMFYPHGDERHMCEQVLRNQSICKVINSKLLFEHLVHEGIANPLKDNYFEPCFPEYLYSSLKSDHKNTDRIKLFFYARPNNPRNMFYMGIEVIDKFLQRSCLNLDLVEIFLVGDHIPLFEFDCGVKPKILPSMQWSDYAAFIKNMDLGLCLMSTPHPSYPPIDLARSGALVVTNACLNKLDLDFYSSNIVVTDFDIDALVEGLQTQLKKLNDLPAGAGGHQSSTTESWEMSFKETFERVAK